MHMDLQAVSLTLSVIVGIGSGALVYALASVQMVSAPTLGYRGTQRRLTREESAGFTVMEPLLLMIASWWGALSDFKRLEKPIAEGRQRIGEKLERAGYYLGLSPDEYVALCILSSLFFGVVTAVIVSLVDISVVWVVVAFVLGALMPNVQVREATKERFKAMTRGLPVAIDLAAMCMGAGMDFPGALRLITENGSQKDIVVSEFSKILASLEVGHTRKHALLELERRIPVESVTDFVRALVQAEEKGNPISEALRVQATVSRMKRSIAAEEAASRAGVLMIIPMIFMLICILILLMGPLVVQGFGGLG